MLSYLSIFVIYGRREGSKFLHFIQYWEFKQIKWKVWHVCHWHMAEDNLINSLTGSEKLKISSLSLIHVEQLSLNWLILKFFLSQAKYIFKMRAFYYCDTVQRQCKEIRSLFVKAPEWLIPSSLTYWFVISKGKFK